MYVICMYLFVDFYTSLEIYGDLQRDTYTQHTHETYNERARAIGKVSGQEQEKVRERARESARGVRAKENESESEGECICVRETEIGERE